MDMRSQLCVFLGYTHDYKGYNRLHIPSGKIYISRDIIFYETRFPFSDSPSTPTWTSSLSMACPSSYKDLLDSFSLEPISPSQPNALNSFSHPDTLNPSSSRLTISPSATPSNPPSSFPSQASTRWPINSPSPNPNSHPLNTGSSFPTPSPSHPNPNVLPSLTESSPITCDLN